MLPAAIQPRPASRSKLTAEVTLGQPPPTRCRDAAATADFTIHAGGINLFSPRRLCDLGRDATSPTGTPRPTYSTPSSGGAAKARRWSGWSAWWYAFGIVSPALAAAALRGYRLGIGGVHSLRISPRISVFATRRSTPWWWPL
jgi:hypothetical protein